MLRITLEQVRAMESALLARWAREITTILVERYPSSSERSGHENVYGMVRQAMSATQAIGGETFDDFHDVTTALFVIGEVERDDAALADLAALLTAEEPFAAKLAMLRLSVPAIGTEKRNPA